MSFSNIKDLPPSTSDLSVIQKVKVLKSANYLIKKGYDSETAIAAAIAASKKIDVKKATKEDEMISYEIVYEPLEIDNHGEWMTAETIKKARDSFESARLSGAVIENLFHIADTDKFKIEQTWIQPEFDVSVVGTDQTIKAGSWVAKVSYSPDLWELKKAGIISGLSVQCSARLNEKTGELTDLNFGVELEEE